MATVDYKLCATCGKPYKPCVNCEEYAGKGLVFWRATCDTTECWQVHMILHSYYHKETDKDTAKMQLGMYLTEDMKPYAEDVRVLLADILQEETKENPIDKRGTDSKTSKSVLASRARHADLGKNIVK